ncbi:MAG: hydrogenase maturation nickel metallochaperone HypA [Chloroflexi bacterium]|jgi:hydrogenase nickel incorporation protein HypA/HybF|nr:hydrogenase maturation nickel metallochaperone HypA [Chloroflexota bacterium]
MHELSAAESILGIILGHAEANHAQKVTKIRLTIGDISGISFDCLEHYWHILAEGTCCEQAEFEVEREPAIFHCNQCGTSFELERSLTACPSCAGINLTLISGDEFQVEDIEIERSEVI